MCRLRVVLHALLGLGLLIAAGCSGDTIREDRSIQFSADGGGLGFQHGDDGIFIAGSDGEGLEQIYASDDATLAVSTPLWSPQGGSLIFTVARKREPQLPSELESSATLDPATVVPQQAWDADPEGRRFGPQDIVYSCMLRRDLADGQDGKPEELFQAACLHLGYVAANLAVRWHPDGKRVLFIDRVDDLQHGLFEFNIQTKQKRQILDEPAHALIFDYAPSGNYLVCLLSNHDGTSSVQGMKIRAEEEGAKWWRVPQSNNLPRHAGLGSLERLTAARPAWSQDELRLAFVQQELEAGSADERGVASRILQLEVATREVEELYSGNVPVDDLYWRPGSYQLGFREGDFGLKILDTSTATSIAIADKPLRRFAGWNHAGSRLAYTLPQSIESPQDHWAFLLPPVLEARDEVYLAPGDGSQAGQLVHSGMRVTFPLWAPHEDSLSLWCTFAPSHSSLINMYLPWTLRPGDPAAILDGASGSIKWMPINADEEAQVGHYFLLKQDYAEAWNWYAKSVTTHAPAELLKVSDMLQFFQRTKIYRDASFFEYYCLSKLGREAEAQERLEEFRRSMRFDQDDAFESLVGSVFEAETSREQFAALARVVETHLQSAYAAEVFLSVGAARDGILFFQAELEAAQTDAARLASGLSLCQLLLADGQPAVYATFAVDRLLPILVSQLQPGSFVDLSMQTDVEQFTRQVEQNVVLLAGGMALLPLMSSDFILRLPESDRSAMQMKLIDMQDVAESDVQRLALDLMLRAQGTAKVAVEGDERAESELVAMELEDVEHRIRQNPALLKNYHMTNASQVMQFIDQLRRLE